MKILNRMMAVALLSAAATVQAAPVVINFDDLASGVVVGANYSGLGVTFVNARTDSFGGLPGGSAPRSIVHDTLFATFGPADAIVTSFSSGVTSVSLTAIDVGAAGFVMTAYDSLIGGSVVDTDSFTGVGIGIGAFHTLTLTGAGILRVEFSQISAGAAGDGVTFDNLVFDATSVPEPGTLSLLALAMLGIGATSRRRL